jgi:hypothetical protein
VPNNKARAIIECLNVIEFLLSLAGSNRPGTVLRGWLPCRGSTEPDRLGKITLPFRPAIQKNAPCNTLFPQRPGTDWDSLAQGGEDAGPDQTAGGATYWLKRKRGDATDVPKEGRAPSSLTGQASPAF